MPERRSVPVWGGRLEVWVQREGQGPPLVFLHPAGGLRWDPLVQALAERFTVHAPELPGTSPEDPEAIYRIDDLWDLVLIYLDLLDALGLERPLLVGHSFGGMLGAELMATQPERFPRAVLVAPVGLWREDAPIPNFIIAPAQELPRLLFADPEGPIARRFFTPPEDPEEARLARVRYVWALACSGKFLWPIPDRGLWKRLHRVRTPTLLVWGRQDRLALPVYAEEFARRMPHARVAWIDGAGHLPQLEQRETTLQAVLGWLQGEG